VSRAVIARAVAHSDPPSASSWAAFGVPADSLPSALRKTGMLWTIQPPPKAMEQCPSNDGFRKARASTRSGDTADRRKRGWNNSGDGGLAAVNSESLFNLSK
jgi:hypothetical protein